MESCATKPTLTVVLFKASRSRLLRQLDTGRCSIQLCYWEWVGKDEKLKTRDDMKGEKEMLKDRISRLTKASLRIGANLNRHAHLVTEKAWQEIAPGSFSSTDSKRERRH